MNPAPGQFARRIGVRAALAQVADSLGVLARELATTTLEAGLRAVDRRPEPEHPAGSPRSSSVESGPPQAWLDYVEARDPVWIGGGDQPHGQPPESLRAESPVEAQSDDAGEEGEVDPGRTGPAASPKARWRGHPPRLVRAQDHAPPATRSDRDRGTRRRDDAATGEHLTHGVTPQNLTDENLNQENLTDENLTDAGANAVAGAARDVATTPTDSPRRPADGGAHRAPGPIRAAAGLRWLTSRVARRRSARGAKTEQPEAATPPRRRGPAQPRHSGADHAGFAGETWSSPGAHPARGGTDLTDRWTTEPRLVGHSGRRGDDEGFGEEPGRAPGTAPRLQPPGSADPSTVPESGTSPRRPSPSHGREVRPRLVPPAAPRRDLVDTGRSSDAGPSDSRGPSSMLNPSSTLDPSGDVGRRSATSNQSRRSAHRSAADASPETRSALRHEAPGPTEDRWEPSADGRWPALPAYEDFVEPAQAGASSTVPTLWRLLQTNGEDALIAEQRRR